MSIELYDYERDGAKILGYSATGEKIDFRKFQVYHFDGQEWRRLQNKNTWKPSPAPLYFSTLPNIRRLNYRIPTLNQIEQLTREQALEILKRDLDFNERMIQIVQSSLKDKFYND